MYQTKGKISAYVFGSGEKCEVESKKVIPWNKETDEWYGLSEEDKKGAYDYTCARMAFSGEQYDRLVKKLSPEEITEIFRDYRNVFQYVPRENVHIPNAELFKVYHDEDEDPYRFLPAWINQDDLEKIQ